VASWYNETNLLLNATDEPFFNRNDGTANIMRESACEASPPFTRDPTCNTDQRSFKAYLSRFYAATYQLAPFTQDFIMTRLKASAAAAAASCNGGTSGTICGLSWIKQTYDDSPYGIAVGGVGEHMAALEVFGSLLAPNTKLPLNELTGTSEGNYDAGTGTSSSSSSSTEASTTGDKAGAGILTTVCLGGLMGLTYWLIRE
jgi:mannan endo-1,6-alpha-mannosidase